MKKIIAMLLCVALIASFGVMAFAAEEGAALVTVKVTPDSGSMPEIKSVEDHKAEIEAGKFTWKSPVVDYAKGAKAAYEAGLDAAKGVLAISNAYKAFGASVLKDTQSAVKAALVAAIKTYQTIYQTAINEAISIEYQKAAVQFADDMNKAIAQAEIDLDNALDDISGYTVEWSLTAAGSNPTTYVADINDFNK